MKIYKKALSVFIAFILLFISFFNLNYTNVSAAEKTIVHIFGTDVNVREKKTTSSTSLCKIYNDVAELLSDEGEWLKIKYNNYGTDIIGYIKYNEGWIRKLTYNPDYRDSNFEAKINAFPESYKESLRLIHSIYPNWKFTAVNVDISIPDAVALEVPMLAEKPENIIMRKLVHMTDHPVSWRSMGYAAYDWSNNNWATRDGNWTGASKEVVAYYMDPRNFLVPGKIFMFLSQTTSSTNATIEDVREIVNKTFMKNGYPTFTGDEYGGDYASLILAAGRANNIDPCVLAAIIWQEQGSGKSKLISGESGFYNFFNIGATGTTNADVIANGIARASSEGWDTIPKSIIGGAYFLKEKYINFGQDTFFFQGFNIIDTANIWRQYATNVQDSYNKGYFSGTPYFSHFDYQLEFKIPVYKNMTDYVYKRPVENEKLNNYYINSINVSNNSLTPSFSRYTYNYAMYIENNTNIHINLPSTAKLISKPEYQLSTGVNTIVLTVQAETGNTNNYYFSVNCGSPSTLTISSNVQIITDGSIIQPNITLGDVNSDGKITVSDIGNIKLYLLGKSTFSGNSLLSADVNKDGKITVSDIGNIKLKILGHNVF